jgi:hypothetical protein
LVTTASRTCAVLRVRACALAPHGARAEAQSCGAALVGATHLSCKSGVDAVPVDYGGKQHHEPVSWRLVGCGAARVRGSQHNAGGRAVSCARRHGTTEPRSRSKGTQPPPKRMSRPLATYRKSLRYWSEPQAGHQQNWQC